MEVLSKFVVSILIVLMLFMYCTSSIYAQGQANRLTKPLADRLYIAQDGSSDATTGVIKFGDDIRGNLISASCSDHTTPSLSFQAVPIEVDGTIYNTMSAEDCGACLEGTMFFALGGDCDDPGFGMPLCHMSSHCCDNPGPQTTLQIAEGLPTNIIVNAENTMKGNSFSTYIIDMGEEGTMSVTTWDSPILFNSLISVMGAIGSIIYKVKVLPWNSITCTWDYDEDAVVQECLTNCDGSDITTWGDTELEWSVWTSTCSEDCGSGSFSGLHTDITGEAFVYTSTYEWKIAEEGDAQFGSIEINEAYTLPTVSGTAGQALILSDTTTAGFADITHLVDRTAGTCIFIFRSKDGTDPTIRRR
jgi:hypothetical protein